MPPSREASLAVTALSAPKALLDGHAGRTKVLLLLALAGPWPLQLDEGFD